MKVWVLSDLHIDALDDPDLGDHPEHDLTIMAGDLADGDFDPTSRLLATFSDAERARMIYVAGNHDAYGIGLPDVSDRLRRLQGETGITTLDRETVEIDGRRIVGCTMWSPLHPNLDELGGDLVAIPGFSGSAWRAAHERDRRWLEETVRESDIVVTHHAPAWVGLTGKMQQNPGLIGLSSGYFADMSDLIEQRQPSLWVHGHTHITAEYKVAETRIVSNARGRGLGWTFRRDYVVEIDDVAPKYWSTAGV
jgi:predicted phosphodiesterase